MSNFTKQPRSRPAWLPVVLVLLGAAGCGLRTTSFKDEGRICLWPAGTEPELFLTPSAGVSYGANQPLEISVVMPDCLSGSCSKDLRATCEVKLSGPQELLVTSAGSYREEGTTCSADCQVLAARCQTPPLPPGTYTIKHGSSQLTLTTPSMTAPPCAGQGP